MAAAVAQAPAAVNPAAPAPVVPIALTQSSSLYVGELHLDVSESVLFDRFNQVGPVTSIRVCRDAVTRRSLGYAYVNFQSPQDAERALDTLNFEPFLGKPCRIMWCQRDPTLRRSNIGNLFIKGLDKSIDNKALYDAFSVFGSILSVKVVYDQNGQSEGRGFVHFETAEAANQAIEKASNTMLKDKKITVELFKGRKERAVRTEQFKNVFVKNLPESFDDQAFLNLTQAFGQITSAVVMKDETGKSKCFGFACYAEFDQATAAVAALNDKEVDGKVLFAGRALKKSERQRLLQIVRGDRRKALQERSVGVNLYIKNLEENVDDAGLREIFKNEGTISSAIVMKDEKGNSRGFGFVSFASQEEATKAITEYNGRILSHKPLYVALAQPKEERRQILALQHRNRIQQARFAGGLIQPGFGFPQQMMYMGGPQQFGGQRPFFGQPGFFGQQPPRQPYGQAPGAFPPRPQQFGGPFQGRPQGGRQPGANQRRGYNYAGNAVNVPAAAPIPTPQQQLATQLASAEPDRQKQILGDHLYPIIAARYSQAAGKLTGMLLQMDNSELLHLIDDSAALMQEVDKAHEALQRHTVGDGAN